MSSIYLSLIGLEPRCTFTCTESPYAWLACYLKPNVISSILTTLYLCVEMFDMYFVQTLKYCTLSRRDTWFGLQRNLAPSKGSSSYTWVDGSDYGSWTAWDAYPGTGQCIYYQGTSQTWKFTGCTHTCYYLCKYRTGRIILSKKSIDKYFSLLSDIAYKSSLNTYWQLNTFWQIYIHCYYIG